MDEAENEWQVGAEIKHTADHSKTAKPRVRLLEKIIVEFVDLVI